ncbi:MAG: reprolysin-like metallopeptidase [Nocardioides sp.]
MSSSSRVRLASAAAVLLAAGVLPALSVSSAGAAPPGSGDRIFNPVRGFTPGGAKARVRPDHFAANRVDLARARGLLRQAPAASSPNALVFSIPTPEGGTERFAVRRTTVLEAGLARAHPEIATYAGKSLDHPGTTIAADVTQMGFHASVRGMPGQRAWYVDPAYDRRGTTTHLSYYGGAIDRTVKAFAERQAPEVRNALRGGHGGSGQGSGGSHNGGGGKVTQRVYRLALTSDPSYAAYFGTQNVLAEKATLINRVNQIYNDDLAIRMLLVDETDQLNLDTEAKATGANGPCGAHPCFDPPDPGDPNDPDDDVAGQLEFCDVPTLGRNRTVLGQLVGASNYDVGHIALGVDGGGVAYLGVVGWDYKGGGCTGLPEPKGDFFAIDYVAHELGHQFGGNHTFNGVQRACTGGNRNAATSVEPGSGSSVMAYAGICAQDNLQPHSDPYFSQRSIDEATAYVANPTLPVVEVQTVSLRGFDTDGDSFRLSFRGRTSERLVRGGNYDAAGVEAVVERLTGKDVTISGWGYDPFGDFDAYPAPLTAPDDTGFQVIFSSNPAPDAPGTYRDQPPLGVTNASGASGFVGETAKGGEADNGGTEVRTRNHAPTVKAPRDRTLPTRTPFTLEASGRDVDRDQLTYLWEQNDIGAEDTATVAGGTSLVDNTKRTGPLFRVFGVYANVTDEGTLESPSPGENLADGNPSRTFPDLAQVLAGNTNAATGRCPTVGPPPAPVPPDVRDCFSEFLPTADYLGSGDLLDRAMHFRVTARDGYPFGGGTAHDDVTLSVDPTAGPLLVDGLGAASVRGGEKAELTWQVNRTDRLAREVRILLSTDGGTTWRVLDRSTRNDGAKKVRIPKDRTRTARIKVEAVDNYFFAVDPGQFRIT